METRRGRTPIKGKQLERKTTIPNWKISAHQLNANYYGIVYDFFLPVSINQISSDQDSFDKGIVTRTNINIHDGMRSADLKIREGWVFVTSRLKNTTLLGKWLFKVLTEDGFGKVTRGGNKKA